MTSAVVTRFAPSPNGRLHLGHALSAITGHELARRHGGRFLLRIEDIDVARSRPELVAGIFDDLAWLGLEWERPVLRQSEHFPIYSAAAARLEALGVLYPCFATRAEITAAAGPHGPLDPDGAPLYPGLWRGREAQEIDRRRRAGQAFAMRLDMRKALELARQRMTGSELTFMAVEEGGRVREKPAHPERWGDPVIVRKDVPTSYHLAVVVDDARQGVTHVTRGLDLLAATDLHRLLQVLLDLPEPRYLHHRLITGEDGRKLSKSSLDTSLAELRAAGVSAGQIRNMLSEF